MKKYKLQDKGGFYDILIQCMLTFFICILIVVCFDYMKIVGTKQSCDQIARTYILRMESVGYLTDEDINQMKNDLAELGITNISTTGTTTASNPSSYGERITLQFSGDYGEYKINEKRISTTKR